MSTTGSLFSTAELLTPDFVELLRRTLARARGPLQLDAVAVLEVAAGSGQLKPHWRTTCPELSLSDCSLTTFDQLLSVPGSSGLSPVPEGTLPAPFAHSGTWCAALEVRPKARAGTDALLIFAMVDEQPPQSRIHELARCLEVGLSADRQRRLERALFCAVESAPDTFELTDKSAALFYANPAWQRTFGHRFDDVVGKTVGSLVRATSKPVHDSAFYQFTLNSVVQGRPWLGSLTCERKDGSQILVEVNVAPFSAEKEGFVGNFAVRRDTSHRAERDRALAISHNEFRSVLSAVPDGVAVLRDGLIYFANQAFLHMLDRHEEDVIGRTYAHFVHADDRDHFEAECESHETRIRFVREDGATRFAEVSPGGAISFEAKPAMILLSRDTTDYRLAQEQLAHAEKLSALGSLAAGVAHEINNPLAYLLLNLQQISSEHNPRDQQAALLAEAIDGANRIHRIVTELHAFSASDRSGEVEAVDVDKAITSATNIALNQIRHRAELRRERQSGLFALASEGPLVQVLLNVLVNAAQAIPENGDAAAHSIRIQAQKVEGSRIRISITDTGVGMSEASLRTVFEPFSSSKRRGEGSGLGLPISKRILDALRGQIAIESELGRGTTVTIELLEASARPLAARESGTRPRPLAQTRVLIVDDELTLARSIARAISQHQTMIATDGASALELLEQDSNFDVILCDLMMPGLSGEELYRVLWQRKPELAARLVFMTGGAFSAHSRAFLQQCQAPVLHKPFAISQLIETIAEIVETEAGRQRAQS